MVSIRSFWLFQLSFVSICFYSLVNAAPWIVTEASEQVVATEYYYANNDYDYLTESSSLVTNIERITPTVTSLPEALSTVTYVPSAGNPLYYDYHQSGDFTVIKKLYPTGVGSRVYGYEEYDTDHDIHHSTVFKVNMTYAAPTGCSTHWTTTIAAEVTPPIEAQPLLPQTAVETSISIDSSQPFQPTTYTYKVIFVDPTQVPTSTLNSVSYSSRPTARYSGADCQIYPGGYDHPVYPYDDYNHEESWFLDSYYMGISPLALTLILVIGWIGLMIILGFIEAFVRFRRLMIGWQTRRGLPVFWSLTILPVTLLLLFFFKKGFRSRSQADAEILKRRWDAMSFGTKLRLFFVWGFRFKYPPMLGPAPARVKTSKHPGMNHGPRLLTPDSGEGSVARSADGDNAAVAAANAPGPAHAEMAEASHPVMSGTRSVREEDDQIGRAN